MKLKILSYNVRGANDKDKRKVIKAFLNSQKVELVCLKETKMQNLDSRRVLSLGAGRNSQWGGGRGLLNNQYFDSSLPDEALLP